MCGKDYLHVIHKRKENPKLLVKKSTNTKVKQPQHKMENQTKRKSFCLSHRSHIVFHLFTIALILFIYVMWFLLISPSPDFNIETVSYRNFSFTMWDIGGQTVTPELYKYHVHEIAAIIYVVDSKASDRLDEARRQLDMVVGDLGCSL